MCGVLAEAACRGSAPHRTDGRSSPNAGTILGCATVHRAWKEARALALPSELAATPLAKRPYDLRHSALSTWLAAGVDPAEVAQRAGNSVEVLPTRYAECRYDRQSLTNQRSEHLLNAEAAPGLGAASFMSRQAREIIVPTTPSMTPTGSPSATVWLRVSEPPRLSHERPFRGPRSGRASIRSVFRRRCRTS
jgi:hypothetical protein